MNVPRIFARFLVVMLAAVSMSGVAMAQGDAPVVTYHANLAPMNVSTVGSATTGQATLSLSNGNLTIQIDVQGAPPDIQHWQHFHGFVEPGKAATCPTSADDKNGDGIIDLIETETTSGTTMVPFNADPVKMDVPANSYPTANADGSYTYKVTVSYNDLQTAFGKAFPKAGNLALQNRVIFIHGVPDSTTLPSTVQSLDDIPANVTLPIACGKIETGAGATPVASPVASPVATPAS